MATDQGVGSSNLLAHVLKEFSVLRTLFLNGGIMLTYNLTQRKDESKYYYIYKSIRRDIEGGTLKKGEKLDRKSTRLNSSH